MAEESTRAADLTWVDSQPGFVKKDPNQKNLITKHLLYPNVISVLVHIMHPKFICKVLFCFVF